MKNDDDEISVTKKKKTLTLAELEDIYEHKKWQPLWTTLFVFGLSSFYMLLPPALQEIALEETMLAIPFLAFRASLSFMKLTDGKYAWLFTIVPAIVLGWLILAILGCVGSAVHNRALRSRQKKRHHYKSRLSTIYGPEQGDFAFTSPAGQNLAQSPCTSEPAVYCETDDDDDDLDDSHLSEPPWRDDLPPPPPHDATPPSVLPDRVRPQGNNNAPQTGPERPMSIQDHELRLHELVGNQVVVVGLQHRSDLNGQYGLVEAYLEDQQRYRVIIQDEAFALRPKNLERAYANNAFAWRLASKG